MTYNIHVDQDQFYSDKNKLKLDTQNEYTFLYVRAAECGGCKKFTPTFNRIIELLSELKESLAIKVHTLMTPSKLVSVASRSTTPITVVPFLILFKGHDIFTIFDVPYETATSLASKIKQLVETEQRDVYSRDIYHNPHNSNDGSSFAYPPRSDKNTYATFNTMDKNNAPHTPHPLPRTPHPPPPHAPPPHATSMYSRGATTTVGSGSHSRFDVQSSSISNTVPNIQFTDDKFLDEWSQYPVHKSSSLYGQRQKH
jgi:hypothetical protein